MVCKEQKDKADEWQVNTFALQLIIEPSRSLREYRGINLAQNKTKPKHKCRITRSVKELEIAKEGVRWQQIEAREDRESA